MSKTKDIIDEALGAVELAKSEPTERKVIPRPQETDDIENDYKYQRENFYNLVEKGTDAIEGILEIARESEHPRTCLLYTSPSPRDRSVSRMPSSA